MPKEFPHTRTYPMQPRLWPWLVGLGVVAVCAAGTFWAYIATTGGN